MYPNNNETRWNPPTNWNNVEPATGEFKKIAPGVYVCQIQNAYITKSKNNNEMLIIEFDIVQGEYGGFYADLTKRLGGNDWAGIYRQMTGAEGNESSVAFFKGFIENIEKSNSAKWDYDFRWFRGKRFAGVFGEEEYIDKNGQLATSCKLFYVNDLNNIANCRAPELKKLKPQNQPKQYGSYGSYNSYGANNGGYGGGYNNSQYQQNAAPQGGNQQSQSIQTSFDTSQGFFELNEPELPF
jgi:hypothetical protein